MVNQSRSESPAAGATGGKTFNRIPFDSPEVEKQIIKEKSSGNRRVLSICRNVEDVQVRIVPGIASGPRAIVPDDVDLLPVVFHRMVNQQAGNSKYITQDLSSFSIP